MRGNVATPWAPRKLTACATPLRSRRWCSTLESKPAFPSPQPLIHPCYRIGA